jgi:hypothetical protein
VGKIREDLKEQMVERGEESSASGGEKEDVMRREKLRKKTADSGPS